MGSLKKKGAPVKERGRDENVWVDDLFRLEEKRWGTWVSYDRNERALVTSLTKELCAEATRFYLKGKQEGFQEEAKSYDGVVGGKL